MAGLFLSALAELVVRNAYHQVSAEATRFVYVFATAALCIAGLAFAMRPLRGFWVRRIMVAAARSVAMLVWVWIVLLSGDALNHWLVTAPIGARIAGLMVAAGAGWLAFNENCWIASRRALIFAAMLFVFSQPLLARLISPDLNWPSGTISRPASEGDGVAYILFDELNARDGAALVEVFEQAGMAARMRAIVPVADGTAKVIPAIWADKNFDSPKPCSFTAICSGAVALDFSKVGASQPDIDVVGFYHPYCAMSGLRWCERLGISLPFDEGWRWRCAFQVRLGMAEDSTCARSRNAAWLKLQSDAVAALWRAPFWSRGGMLYAHLPLPHPPGSRLGGTLQDHYRDNLKLVRDLLQQMVARARESGLRRVQFIVFSDHPLRQEHWCSTPTYSRQGCRPNDLFEDHQIPLVVGSFGVGLPVIEPVVSNADIFKIRNVLTSR